MRYISVIAFIFVLEYNVKNYMDKAYPSGRQRPLACGRAILKTYYNTGAAGNFLSGHPKAVRRIHTAALGIVLTAMLWIYRRKGAAMAKLGLSFLIGAGASNLYDRLAKGHVVDYISFGFGPERFRKLVFNISDFFVFAGILLCVAQILEKEGELWQHRG